MTVTAAPGRGILLMVSAMVVFSLQDAITKTLVANHPAAFVTMIRYWAFAAFVVALSARRVGGLRAAARTRLPWLQVGRGVLLVLEIVVTIVAFDRLGLAPTHVIFAVTPLIVVALSGPLLGEHVGWRRWTAVAVGFAGVVVIMRPGAQVFDPDALIPLLAAGMFALYNVATRYATRVDGATTSFFYTGVAGAVTITLIGPFYWSELRGWDIVLMITLCLTGMTGHYMLISALEKAEASRLQPFSYLQLVFAIGLGMMLFDERIDLATAFGASMIVGAGLFSLWRERVRKIGKVDSAPTGR